MYWRQSQHIQRLESYSNVMSKLSPQLQGDLAYSMHARWLDRVWFLRGERAFVVEVATALGATMYAPSELIKAQATLSIIKSGIAARRGKVLSRGSMWGLDFVVNQWALMDHSPVRSLSYTEVNYLTRAALEFAARSFPKQQVEIRRATIWITLKCALIKLRRRNLAKRSLGNWGSHGEIVETQDPEEIFASLRRDTRDEDHDDMIHDMAWDGRAHVLFSGAGTAAMGGAAFPSG